MGEGLLSLNTCVGGMMFWQRGPTFTFLTGDTVSVTTSSHQRNAIEFAGKPMRAQQSSRKRRITRIGTHVFSLGRMIFARRESRVRMFF